MGCFPGAVPRCQHHDHCRSRQHDRAGESRPRRQHDESGILDADGADGDCEQTALKNGSNCSVASKLVARSVETARPATKPRACQIDGVIEFRPAVHGATPPRAAAGGNGRRARPHWGFSAPLTSLHSPANVLPPGNVRGSLGPGSSASCRLVGPSDSGPFFMEKTYEQTTLSPRTGAHRVRRYAALSDHHHRTAWCYVDRCPDQRLGSREYLDRTG
jgi:hypothetical protein